VQNGLLASIVPFDRYASPILLSDRANIVGIFVPANPVSDLDFPGLFTGHLAAQSEPCFSLRRFFCLLISWPSAPARGVLQDDPDDEHQRADDAELNP
jgi:hypothetical protein